MILYDIHWCKSGRSEEYLKTEKMPICVGNY